MINLYGLPLYKLEQQMLSEGQSKFRAKQLYSWIYEKHVTNFDDMSDISKSFRDVLKEKYCLDKPSVYVKQVSKDGTIKLLLELADGSKVETVLMRYDYGNVICVTSQVGCAMGCSFCASGLLAKQRDLTAAEMVGELVVVDDMLREEGNRVTHIVVMGTGEPFDNYDNVMDFVRVANEQKGFAIGARHITVSTSGIVPRIYDYANEGLQINLAISLHAPNNELRSRLMKVNKAYPLDQLIPAIAEYNKIAGRRGTYEYIMIKGVNDTLECAKQLVELIKPTFAYVNLIPYNDVLENGYHRAESSQVKAFMDYLMKHGVKTTIRKEFGSDIDAACGQLRAKEEGKL